MANSLNQVPRAVELAAIQYWTAVYNGDAKQIEDTLDPDVQVVAHCEIEGQGERTECLIGREQVVAKALEISSHVKSVENFGLKFALVEDEDKSEKLAIYFVQQLVVQQNPNAVAQMSSTGMEIWSWKALSQESASKVVFTAGEIFEKDKFAENAAVQKQLNSVEAIVIKKEGQKPSNQAGQGKSLRTCVLI
jgi:hypothetical protein